MDGERVMIEEACSEELPRASSRRSGSRSSARQMAVNFMPSRQLPYNTLRHRRSNSEHNVLLDEVDGEAGCSDDGTEDKQAENIVKELEQQKQLMEDSPLSEELRREALRELPQGLTMKRTVRAKLSVSVSLRSKRRPISLLRRTKYRISFAWKRTKERIRDAMFSVELWYEAIRNIEGQFGSAVGSYFRMLRRLFVLNAAFSVLLVCFIVAPQALHDSAVALDRGEAYWPYDWITGLGGMQDTLMFYGHYHSEDIGPSLSYNMPFAYFFTVLCVYLSFLCVLCYRTAYSYRRNFISSGSGVSNKFASKLFCGWDFGVVSPHAASLNAASIYNDFKELLNEQNKKTTTVSFCTKLGQRLTNILVSVTVLAVIAGLLAALWQLLTVADFRSKSKPEAMLAISALVVVGGGLGARVFRLVGRLEFYSVRAALYVTLTRTWLLYVSVLMLLFVFWSTSDTKCWETSFGQETYRLVLLDAIVSLLVLPAVDIVRAWLYKVHSCGSPPEFDIAFNSLTLIYNQSVLWFGMLFSPLLAVAVTIKFLLLFYVKRECAIRACQPAKKVWRAAQTQTVLYMLVTLSLFSTLFGIGSLFLRMPSRECGPFRAYSHVFAVVSAGVLRLHERDKLRYVLSWTYRPGVMAFFVLLLCVVVYYTRARARAHQAMVSILRHMVVLQARDKDFLLTAIGKVAGGEWLYSPKPEEAIGDSHTGRYLRDVRKPSNSSFHFDGARLSRSFTERPRHHTTHVDDGDTDSSFSWQGSGNQLNSTAQIP